MIVQKTKSPLFPSQILSFMFREYDQMLASAEQYFSYDINSWSLIYIHAAQTFITGLSSFALFRKTKDPKWAEKGSKAKFQMKKWAENCEWNFSNKVHLFEAEQAFCFNDINGAKALYEKAISSAREHR